MRGVLRCTAFQHAHIDGWMNDDACFKKSKSASGQVLSISCTKIASVSFDPTSLIIHFAAYSLIKVKGRPQEVESKN